MRSRGLALRIGMLAVLGFMPCPSAGAADKKIAKNLVPAAVISAFEQAYPKATVKDCAKEVENGKTYYEIESMDGNTARDLLYLPDGRVAEIEESVAEGNLPAAVREAVAKKYPEGKIVKAEMTTHGAVVQYDLGITAGKAKVEMSVDPTGQVVGKRKSSEGKKTARKK